jgi:hypothetical protein
MGFMMGSLMDFEVMAMRVKREIQPRGEAVGATDRTRPSSSSDGARTIGIQGILPWSIGTFS